MRNLLVAATLFSLAISASVATSSIAADASSTPTQSACEGKAMSKDGKPLAGAAKTAFVKKCMGGSSTGTCESKALSKDGKPLSGAAKTAFIKKCLAAG